MRTVTGNVLINENFWRGKRVFLTGHTGFKGSWLSIWLHSLGADVTGYALDPPTEPSLFALAGVDSLLTSIIADVRDLRCLQAEMLNAAPEIVIHMAAQPLVRDSYKIPVETYSVNVMGTVNLLESIRNTPTVKAVVNVTTDKVYENREWVWGYRENEPMGGYDPYSNSKGCSELVTAAYRSSYFNPCNYDRHGVAVATARAGNVIGGGDWADDRLIPDIIKAIMAGKPVQIRNPHAIRPWQHVLEPLSGYLLLAERLFAKGANYAAGWNFGPPDEDARPVGLLVERLCAAWGEGAAFEIDRGNHPHEAHYLKLDCSKARSELGWSPRWSLEKTVQRIVEWTQAYRREEDLLACCRAQIAAYTAAG
jgi:CDP-glucose 4,6-dehydratase